MWLRDQKVRLKHVDTNGYLHSHDMKYPRPIAGQHEVGGGGNFLPMSGCFKMLTGYRSRGTDVKLTYLFLQVCALPTKSSNNLWVATQGVYLPVVR